MPEISRFLGIVIAILYRDHEPPHFHATYGEYEVTVRIRDGISRAGFRVGHWGTSSNGTRPTDRSSRRTGSGRGTDCRYRRLSRWSKRGGR